MPLWHTALLAKCSVLYLLSRLAGKMRVSPDGNACFARQENGQVFADGDEQKAGRFREWQRGYEPVVIKLVFGVFLYDNS